MAPLTWRNVDAPNFSGVNASLGTASALLNNVTSGLSDAIDKRRSTQRMGASSAAMAAALQLGSGDEIRAALASGALGDPSQLTPDALNFLGNREGTILANEGTGIRNRTGEWNLTNAQSEQARRDAEYAARPAANARMVEIRNLFGSSNPDDQIKAQKLYGESSELFTKAGIDVNSQLEQLGEGFRASDAGRSQLAAQQAEQDRLRERDRTEMQRGRVDSLVSGPTRAGSYEEAVSRLRNQDLDAKTRASLMDDLTANKDRYFPPANAYDQLNTPPGTAQTILNNYGSNRSTANTPQSSTPTFDALRHKTEGGSNYDTLYGNSQRPGGRYEGIRPSQMTIAEVIDFQRNSDYGDWVKSNNPKGARATPVGASQIVGTTLRGAVREMGLDPNTVFDKDTQEAVTMHIAKKAVAGASTMDGKVAALRGQWDGFKNASRAEVEQAVREIEGTAVPSASALMRDSVVRNGGARTGYSTNALINRPTAPEPVAAPLTVQVDDQLGSNPTTTPAPAASSEAGVSAGILGRIAPDSPLGRLAGMFSGGDETAAPVTPPPVEAPVAAAPVVAPATTATAPAARTEAPAANSAATANQVLTAAQIAATTGNVANVGVIDRNLNSNAALNAALQRADPTEAPGSVAARLTGENGSLKSVRPKIVEDAINEVQRRIPNITAAAAGALIENSKTTTDLRGIWGRLTLQDRLAEGNNEQRIDVDKAVNDYRRYVDPNNNTPGRIAEGVGALNKQDASTNAQTQIQVLQQQAAPFVAVVDQLTLKIQQDVAAGRQPSPSDLSRLEMAAARVRAIEAQIQALPVNQYSGTALSRP